MSSVSWSIIEVEYHNVAFATIDIVWLELLLGELHMSLYGKTVIWCENSSAIVVSSDPILHSKFKHVELDLLFV